MRIAPRGAALHVVQCMLLWGAAQSRPLDGGAAGVTRRHRRHLLVGHLNPNHDDCFPDCVEEADQDCLIPELADDLRFQRLDVIGYHPTAPDESVACELSPPFQPTILDYSCDLPFEHASIIVTPNPASGDRNNPIIQVISPPLFFDPTTGFV